ncbi:MAG TPA: rhomboid family intramembrane serine protease [Myxococcota bacterium]|nr:rhomboid family intramembrane serine protease [Myxococcota bacterium]
MSLDVLRPEAGRPERGAAPVALALLGAALVTGYGVELTIGLRGGSAELESFLHAFGLVPREVLGGRVHPLLTAIFLHADPIHLLANLAFLVAFGAELEARVGARRFAAAFVGFGLVGGLIHVAAAPSSFVPTVGASGAVSGVLGAWWRLCAGDGAATRPRGRAPAFVLLALWVGAQAAVGLGGGPGGAGWAHLGGFAAGLVAAPWLATPARPGAVRARTS